MAIPEAPIPGIVFDQIVRALHQQTAATLAAAVVAASGQKHSIQQVLDIAHDIYLARNPQPNHGHYMEWLKTKDARLSKVHGA